MGLGEFDSRVAHLCPGFTTSDVAAALRSQSDPDLALDLFRWISHQRGYCPDPLAYLAIIDIIASGKRFSAAESLRASLATLLIKLSENLWAQMKRLRFMALENNRLTAFYSKMGKRFSVGITQISISKWGLQSCSFWSEAWTGNYNSFRCYMFCNFIACLRASLFFFHMKLIRKLRTPQGGHRALVGSLYWNKHILTIGGKDLMIIDNDLASGRNDSLLYIWDQSMASLSSQTRCLHKFEDHVSTVKAITWCPHESNLPASSGSAGDQFISELYNRYLFIYSQLWQNWDHNKSLNNIELCYLYSSSY
ncbi:hypothetical protein MRB53_010265 [Persea americana]|uniref:Uncharacterized protein n=1 Tax=Persea americana TaxID=3435 RepID=A0ACC2LS53_PERAE|nr:hypothetical protein MRB53_010265 [Persea americana]